jgi:hypothetical protein
MVSSENLAPYSENIFLFWKHPAPGGILPVVRPETAGERIPPRDISFLSDPSNRIAWASQGPPSPARI